MKQYADVEAALSENRYEDARELLRDYLQEKPDSAQVWYLASQAAINEQQRQYFLTKAVQCDPLHAPAGNALHDLLHPRQTPAETGDQQQEIKTETLVLASLINRAAAFCIDYILLMIVSFFLSFVSSFLISMVTSGEISSKTAFQSIQFWGLLTFSAYVAYYGFTLSRYDGQTFGKRWMGVRVIKRNRKPLTWWDAFLRCWVGYLLALSPLGLGFFWALIDPQQRGWHDIISDTLVIEA